MTCGPKFSLTPGFSQVLAAAGDLSRFNGFPGTGARKPLKRLPPHRLPNTGLKPGVNERMQPSSSRTTNPRVRVWNLGMTRVPQNELLPNARPVANAGAGKYLRHPMERGMQL